MPDFPLPSDLAPEARASEALTHQLASTPVVPARILIVSDAWKPQVNGVVRTLTTLSAELARLGHIVEVIGPDRFHTMPCPTYPDIPLCLLPGRKLRRMIEGFRPDALHVATEGPLGWAARSWARHRGLPFTTSYHTRFPEYVRLRAPVPESWLYGFMRRFHAAGNGTMVATGSLRRELAARGFDKLRPWTRGVDLAAFRPGVHPAIPAEWASLPRPIFLSVGRVAPEKNIDAFLALDLPGSKMVVGDGPALPHLKAKFPGTHFAGARFGEELRAAFAHADVFVFPSRTDTFGLVMLESLACGTPVAGYPVTGPVDVLENAASGVGALDQDLRTACMAALQSRDANACRAHAEQFSWSACTSMFVANLAPFPAATTA